MQAKTALANALNKIFTELGLPEPAKLTIEEPRQQRFGDLSTNAAMLLAKYAGKTPRELAQIFAERLPELCTDIEKVDVAGPGFCNITFKPTIWQAMIPEIEAKAGSFGHSDAGNGRRALVEYVSANPTGPLHVGHGRGAALGDSVARVLRAAGYSVETEYYLNDAGRQMRLLGESIWCRALQASGQKIDYPEDCYQGDYIGELAVQLLESRPGLVDLPEDEAVPICRKFGIKEILAGIKLDLAAFRCEHQHFASEKALVKSGAVTRALKRLEQEGYSYNKDGALWLETGIHGDDHDRVLRKSDGSLTYFATDIAYHHDKFERGFDWLIDVWGADHHGYIPRMQVAIRDMGHDPSKFSVLLVQLVNLMRDGKPVAMSTRSGQFVTLEEVIKEVGVDAARFTFLSRSHDSPLDFDLELAKRCSMDNPVYYVQYAHARVCALLRRAEERGITLPEMSAPETLHSLSSQEEIALLRQLAAFEGIVAMAAKNLAPYQISKYLLALAGIMHGYYAHRQILDSEDCEGSQARLALLRACGQTIKNGLFLLGVSAPEIM